VGVYGRHVTSPTVFVLLLADARLSKNLRRVVFSVEKSGMSVPEFESPTNDGVDAEQTITGLKLRLLYNIEKKTASAKLTLTLSKYIV